MEILTRGTPEHTAQRLINIGLGHTACERRKALIIIALERLAWSLMLFMGKEDAAMFIYSLGDKMIVSKESSDG